MINLVRKELLYPKEAGAIQYNDWDSVLQLSERCQVLCVPRGHSHDFRRDDEYEGGDPKCTVLSTAKPFVVIWDHDGIRSRVNLGDWVLFEDRAQSEDSLHCQYEPHYSIFTIDDVAKNLLYKERW